MKRKILGLMSMVATMSLLFSCAQGSLTAPAPSGSETQEGVTSAPSPLTNCGPGMCAPKNGSPYFAGDPGAGVQFLDFGTQRQDSQPSAVLTDIVTHLPSSYGSTYYDSDPITWGHETTHGINSELRNNYNNTGTRANGFYVLEDRALIIEEPQIRKSHANPYVPASLRGSRYDLYLAGSQSWDDTPLYIWDEWFSYTNGSAVGVDMVNNGLWNRGWRDGVAGTLEFVVYGIALAMAVEEHDPDYFQNNTQFLEALAWNVQRSMDLYYTGSQMADFAWETQDNYLAALRTSPDADTMRAWCTRVFGAAWTAQVLLGTEVPDDGGNDEPPAIPDPNDNPGDDPDDNNLPDPPDVPGDDPNDDPNNDPNQPEPPDVDPGDNGDFGDDPLPEPLVNDEDGDGIENEADLCRLTRPGDVVWTFGEWMGCAEGQFRDPMFEEGGPDLDLDMVPDTLDLCSNTNPSAPVWTHGEWLGCAEGQFRDTDVLGDADRDGVIDAQDLCANTAPGASVWGNGDWMGCAEGQARD